METTIMGYIGIIGLSNFGRLEEYNVYDGCKCLGGRCWFQERFQGRAII